MKNQLQTAITQRDRAVQVALNFVGHHISSSDGSYDLLKECIYDAIREAYAEGAASMTPKEPTEVQLSHACQCSECDPL